METEILDDIIPDIVLKVGADELNTKEACARLKQLCSSEQVRMMLLDCVWLESLACSENEKFRLQDLVAGLVQQGVVPIQDVVKTLEIEMIADEIQNADVLRRKRTQTKTRRVYTIPKFNLFSECPEGYSAVVDMIWSVLKHGISSEESSILQAKLKAAIGFFQLCPTKTISVILSLVTHAPDAPGVSSLVEIIKSIFPVSRVTPALAFHLLSFGRSEEGNSGPSDPAEETQPNRGKAPIGLLKTIAILQREGLLDLAELWSLMASSNDSITAAANAFVTDYNKLNDSESRILAGVFGGSEEEEQISTSARFAEIVKSFSNSVKDTQKFLLLAELIRSNQFEVAIPLLTIVQSSLSSVPIGSIEVIREALLDHIDSILGEDNSMDTGSRDAEIAAWLPRILELLGVFLGARPSVMAVLLEWTKRSSSVVDVKLFLGSFILPAMSLGDPNPSLCALVWDCLISLPSATRFSVYQQWDASYEKVFALPLLRQSTTNQTRSLLKRVVKGAQVGDTASRNSHYQFAKLCCCNPLVVLKYVVSNIQIQFNYNLIEPYVEVSSKIPPIAQDIMSFIVASSLVGETRPSLNMKTATVEPWLNNLAEFTGRFFKRHPSTPLDALMRLIPASMTASNGDLLKAAPARVLLEAIIEHMGDFSVVHQLNAEQIEAISGGPVLNSLVQASQNSSVESGKAVERAKAALKQALLCEPGLVRTLYTSLGNQLADLTSTQEVAQELIKGGGLKLLGLLYDGVFSCLLQLTEFLNQNCDKTEYMSILPENPLTLFRSRMDPGLAFHILRPGWADEWTEPLTFEVFPESTNVTRSMFGCFWKLSLSDISVPTTSYEKQGFLLREKISGLESSLEKLEKSKDVAESKDQIRSTKRDLARHKDLANKLELERVRLTQSHDRVMEKVRSDLSQWWKNGIGNKMSTLDFISEMVSKRVFLSIQDAMFCSYFVKLLAKEKVVGFQFLDFFNQWTELLAQTVSSSSEGEIKNLAEFIRDMMGMVVEMRKSDNVFSSYVTEDNTVFNRSYFSPAKAEITPVSKSELARAHLKWESNITKALKAGLSKDTADWCEKRNCLNIISRTCELMPIIHINAADLTKTVQALAENAQDDIATFAQSLGRKLASLESNWMDRTASSAPVISAPPAATGPPEEPGPEPEQSEDAKMEDISENEGSKRTTRGPAGRRGQQSRVDIDRKLEESPRKTARRPTRDPVTESAAKRHRGDDRYESTRDATSRQRNNDAGTVARTRDRGGTARR